MINARWVKPLDSRLVEWAGDHELVLTIEDNVVSGGFGAAVLEALSAHGMAGRVRMLGIGDGFLPAGSADEVLHTAGLDVEGIAPIDPEPLTTTAGYTGSASVRPVVLAGNTFLSGREFRSCSQVADPSDSIEHRRHPPAPPVMFTVPRTTKEGAK